MQHRRGIAGIVAIVLPGALAGGCTSSTELTAIQGQLADIQRQLLQVQRQTPSKEDLTALQATLREEIDRIVKSEADTGLEIDRLASQIAQLQARLEETTSSLTQLSQRIAATNQELKTLRTPPPQAGPGEGASTALPPTTDPEALYQAAYNDYLRGNYDLAILGFRQYVANFPDTESADNALYWIGECYFSQGKHRQAIKEFSDVQSRYSTSDRLPSALLKKGYAYLELGEREQGIVQLRSVIRDYPSSDIAVLARQHLRQLGVDVD
jgi:tol-pal system protein YbgF